MNNLNKITLLAIFANIAITGCTYDTNSSIIDYRGEIEKVAELDIPPELVEKNGIKKTNSNISAKELAIINNKPTDGNGNTNVALPTKAIIGKEGAFRFLETEGKVGDIWDSLHSFFDNNGLQVDKSDAATGVIQTKWQENVARLPDGVIKNLLNGLLGSLLSGGTSQVDKYHAIVESIDNNRVRVYLAHYGLAEEFTDASKVKTRWYYRPSEPLLVLELLKRFALALGDENPNINSSGNSLPESQKTKVLKSGLILPLARDKSWQKLLLAMPADGWEIKTINPKSFLMNVRAPVSYKFIPSKYPETETISFRVELTENQGQTLAKFIPLSGKKVSANQLIQVAKTLNWE